MNKRTRRVLDDDGRTRQMWVPVSDLAGEKWRGLHIHGQNGKPRGRPAKPLGELSSAGRRKRLARAARNDVTGESGRYYFGYVPSTRDDWAREHREREAAFAFCRQRGLALGPF